MLNKKLLAVIIILLPIAVISFFKTETIFNDQKAPEIIAKKDQIITVKLKLNDTNEIIEKTLEDYIIGVVSGEMPATFHEEALKAQAIASRTYAYNKIDQANEYDLIDTIDNQVYISEADMKEKWQENFDTYYNKVKKAVSDTKNLIVTYNNEPITTYYFAMSNGKTEDSQLVFNEEKPYLKSVDSIWDNETIKNYNYETTFPQTEFCQKLNIDCTNLTIGEINRSKTNRVNTIVINNKTISGTEFRKILEIRSTDFEIELNNNTIYIKTKGYGHGVGMSQYGANGMANDGNEYPAIIKHYYQNTEIKNLNDV